MALKNCPECKSQVSSEARTCPHCGKKLRMGSLGKFLIGMALVGTVLIVIISNLVSSGQKSPETPKPDMAMIKTVTMDLIKTGLIKNLKPELNQVFVYPPIWKNLDFEAKKNFSRMLAAYCSDAKGSSTEWVEVYDSMSGKKLAKYGSWGFETF